MEIMVSREIEVWKEVLEITDQLVLLVHLERLVPRAHVVIWVEEVNLEIVELLDHRDHKDYLAQQVFLVYLEKREPLDNLALQEN